MDLTNTLLIVVVAAFTLVAAISDVRTRRLPNWLTVPVFALGLVFHLLTGGWPGLLLALGGFATGFGVLLVLWLIGGSGAGDVKFMGALGAWLGAGLTLYVFVISTALVAMGSVLILVVQTARRGLSYVRRRYFRPFDPARTKDSSPQSEARQDWREKRRLLPYALPVALGTWLVLAWKLVPLVQ